MNLHQPLIDWCHAQLNRQGQNPPTRVKFLHFGSTRFFGTGADTDIMFLISDIPANLIHLLPEPKVDVNYAEPFSRLIDEDTRHDFIFVCQERFDEFTCAVKGFNFLLQEAHDIGNSLYQQLKEDKTLRKLIFRALRSTHAKSELIASDGSELDDD